MATLSETDPPVTVSVPPAEKTPPPFASETLSVTWVFSMMSVPDPAFLTPAPSWSDVLRRIAELVILIVPMVSSSAWFSIALESGSKTPGAGTCGIGSCGFVGSGTNVGSSIIGPGLSVIWLPSIVIVPAAELLIAAPPPPA